MKKVVILMACLFISSSMVSGAEKQVKESLSFERSDRQSELMTTVPGLDLRIGSEMHDCVRGSGTDVILSDKIQIISFTSHQSDILEPSFKAIHVSIDFEPIYFQVGLGIVTIGVAIWFWPR